ncbi:MAG TPA: hypothetical protein VIY70_09780 [Acidimicrobiia bacterium]
MWRDVERESGRFDSAVLSTVTESGPISVRCRATADPSRRILVIHDPGASRPGPASILYHRHDERLWKLRSCLIVGRLEESDSEWSFVAERFVPGMGVGGPLSYLRFLRKGRSTAARYLERRGLPRPEVAWDEIGLLLDRAASADRNVAGTQAP